MRAFDLQGYIDNGTNSGYWTSLASAVANDIVIPWWTRNDNGTPTAEGFNLELVDTIDSNKLLYLKRVKFYIDGTPRFLGVVDIAQPQKSKRVWEYIIKNGFYELTKYKIESNALASLADTNDPYKFQPNDRQYSNVSVPWLLETLLAIKNLPVDASALYTETSDNLVLLSSPYYYYLRDIKIDLAMLYALNQQVAVFFTTIDSDNTPGYNFSQNKITAFELFQFLCGVFSITVRFGITDSFPDGAYILERRANVQTIDERYVIGQGDVWTHKQKSIKVEEPLFPDFEQRASNRANYRGYTITNVQSWETRKGKGQRIKWYDNLIFLLQDKTETPGVTQDMNTDFLKINHLEYSLYFNENRYSENITEFECPIQNSFYNVKEHFFYPRNESSIIKQGVFVA
ncbi:MAG: hypothetical protein AB1432_01535 [Bacteroidota bacterium]